MSRTSNLNRRRRWLAWALVASGVAGAIGSLTAPITGSPAHADPPECDIDPQCADVVVVKRIDDPIDYLPGPVRATWRIGVQNSDTNDATSASVSDVLPAGVVFVSHTMSAPASCTFPPVGSNGTISCTVDLPARESWELEVEVETSTAGTYVNQVTADTVVGKGRNDPDGTNNTSTSTWSVRSGDPGGDQGCLGCNVDVAFDKTYELDPDNPTLIRFHLRAQVGDQGPVPQVVFTDTLQPAFAYGTWSTIDPGRVTCSHDGSPTGGTVTCTALPANPDPFDTSTWLKPGEQVHVLIEAKIVGGGDCTNRVRGAVYGFQGAEKAWTLSPIRDPDPKNDAATVAIPLPVGVDQEPSCVPDKPDDGGGGDGEPCDPCKQDASISKSIESTADATTDPVFQLQVRSNSVSPIPFVIVRDVLPDRLEFQGVAAPPGVDCTFSDPDSVPGGGELTCVAPASPDPEDPDTWLQPGDSFTIEVQTNLLPTGSQCTNVASVETWTFLPPFDKQGQLGYQKVRFSDDNPANDESSVTFGRMCETTGGGGDGDPGGDPDPEDPDDPDDPDEPGDPTGTPVLELDKQVEAVSVIVGEPFTYRLVYRNVGDGDATDVTVTDDVPAGLQIVEVSEGCTVDAQHVECVDPLVPPGVERAFLVTVVPSFEGTFVNEARVTSREGDPEVDDEGTPTDRVEVEVRRSTTPTPATTVPSTGTGTDAGTGGGRLPTTGASLRLAVVAASLAVLGVGLLLLTDSTHRFRTVPVPVGDTSGRRRRNMS